MYEKSFILCLRKKIKKKKKKEEMEKLENILNEMSPCIFSKQCFELSVPSEL